jgi:hypothetical protein
LLQEGQASVEASNQFAALDVGDILLCEVESSFNISEQVEHLVAEALKRLRDAAGKPAKGLLEFISASRFDNREDRFSAGQIELTSQEPAQRKLAGLSAASTPVKQFGEQEVQERWTRESMQLDDILPCVRSRSGPVVES